MLPCEASCFHPACRVSESHNLPAILQDNRDKRVELLQKYARKFFPSTKYLDYAIRVEGYTLGKAANLVLNVDGCIGALFLDLLNSSSQFSQVLCREPHDNLSVDRLDCRDLERER